MKFNEAVDFLYSQLPIFQRQGAAALKKDLTNTIFLLEKLGNPHFKFKAVHIAGTNGKGSSAHFIASILQSAGYNAGLYTSPHLKSFTERIKINGKEVSEDFVGEFVERVKPLLSKISPSFFEMTVAMAFDYFAQKKIDIAVVEVGLGGRLDSTNVLMPEVSLITNISYDHTDLLGNTLEQIAFEKAGIIKNSRPVVIGKRQEEVAHVFSIKAKSESTRIYFASDEIKLKPLNGAYQIFRSGKIWIELMNVPIVTDYIIENLPGVLQTIILLRQRGFIITDEAIKEGIREMVFKTGLKGRWQKINDKPLAICDVAHNLDGILKVLKEIRKIKYNKLLMVWGCVKDKDIEPILAVLPKNASYYFCQPDIPRAMDASLLREKAENVGLTGVAIPNVEKAFQRAVRDASEDDFIFVGGSTFVVAELENL